MITISENALKELDAFFSDKDKTPVRIYLAPGGCHGPRLALALDEPGEDDHSEEVSGYTFCLGTALLQEIGGVAIDVNYMGFVVEPEIPLPASASSCGTCGSCGSCGSSCGQ